MFEDQFEQLKELFQSVKERVQESSLYQNIYEKYVSLSPRMQKIVILVIMGFAAFLLVSPPLAKYRTSNENLSDFQTRKDITQRIIQQAKSGSSKVKTPKMISQLELSNSLNSYGRSPVINLADGQASVIVSRDQGKSIVPPAEQASLKIIGKELNSSQALNLAYSFKRYNSSLLITRLSFKESDMKPGYFESEIGLTNLYVPTISEILPKPEINSGPKKRSNRRSRRR